MYEKQRMWRGRGSGTPPLLHGALTVAGGGAGGPVEVGGRGPDGGLLGQLGVDSVAEALGALAAQQDGRGGGVSEEQSEWEVGA